MVKRQNQGFASIAQGQKTKATVDRRAVLGGLASLGAGLAIAPAKNAGATATANTFSGHEGRAAGSVGRTIASDRATVVELRPGKIRGYKRDGIYIFKGVPYGASTSGVRRFMPAAPPEPWAGIRNALSYGRICPQEDSAHFMTDGKNLASHDEDAYLLHRGSAIWVPGEDCLRVNLWTPEINGSRKRPVMVYMHGGGFSGGCGHDLLSYEGENLARNHDVVLVNHNHRLNVYGYLNLESIGGEQFAASANIGMLDCVAVLEWVRENITLFGGDPGNVTIFGQSGGGGKVAALMAMPAAKGLFHRAIIQSGPFLKALMPDYSQRVAELTVNELGLSKGQVKELQTIPVDRLSGAAAEAMKKMPRPQPTLHDGFGISGWGPTVDGRLLPVHPFDPTAPNISADVPLITGTNLNESVSGLDRQDADSMTSEELHRRVREEFGSQSEAIIDAYRQDYPKESPFGLYAAIATSRWRIPAFVQAERKAALGKAPAYAYVYAWRTPALDDRPGTFHAAEISFVFDNAAICDHYSTGDPAASTLSRQMSSAWVNFARNGDPNHHDLPQWPVYTGDTRATMYFNSPSNVRNAPEARGLKLIADT